MLSLTLILVLAAFIAAIASTWNPPRCPLWVAVLLLCIAMLANLLPK